MGWNIGKDIAEGAVGGIIGPIKDLISEFIVDKDKQQEMANQIAVLATTQAHEQVMAQVQTNLEEAKSSSVWVSGWRPSAGWVCVLGLFQNFFVVPNFGPLLDAYTKIHMVPLDLTVMLPLLLGLLGLTVSRSVDKFNGVAS